MLITLKFVRFVLLILCQKCIYMIISYITVILNIYIYILSIIFTYDIFYVQFLKQKARYNFEMYYKVEMIKNKQFYQKKIKNKITLTIIKKNSDF